MFLFPFWLCQLKFHASVPILVLPVEVPAQLDTFKGFLLRICSAHVCPDTMRRSLTGMIPEEFDTPGT